MPIFTGEPWRGAARVRRANATNDGFRDWAVGVGITSATPSGDQTTWTGSPGSSLTLTYHTGTSGTLPPNAANTVSVNIRAWNGAVIGSTWTPTADGQTRTFHFDDDPLDQAAGSARSGPFEIYIRVVRTDVGTYDVDSRGTGAAANDQWARGKLRSPVTLSSFSASDVSLGGAEPATFEAFDPFHHRVTLGAQWITSAGLTLEHRQGGVLRRTQTVTSTATTRDYSWSAAATGTTGNGRCNNDYTKGSTPVNPRLLLPSSTFGNDREYAWAVSGHPSGWTRANDESLRFATVNTTVADSSSNAAHGTRVGSPLPALTVSPWSGFGNALEFDGVLRLNDTQAVDLGVFGITGACCVEARFTAYEPAGSWRTIVGHNITVQSQMNFWLGVNPDGKLEGIFASGAFSETRIVGTTSLVAGTRYAAALDYNGTTMRLWLRPDGGASVLEGSTALAQIVDNVPTTKVYIGRRADAFTPEPWFGVIDSVRISTASRYAASFDPGSSPFTNDATTRRLFNFEDAPIEQARITADPTINFTQLFQINDSAFGTPPSSKNVASGRRLTSDLGFLASRATTASGGTIADGALAWTKRLWDTGELIGSEASPVKQRASTSSTKGGQAGWSDAFLSWDNSLPSGSWTQKQTITTADMTGLESGNTRTLTLLASNPSIRIICGGGPAGATLSGVHCAPGLPFQVGLGALNVDTGVLQAIDSGGASILIARLQHTGVNAGYAEYLDSDGVTWVRLAASSGYFWPLGEAVPGSKVYIRNFAGAQTRLWGDYDLFLVARAVIGGTPYSGGDKEIVVGPYNMHALT